MSETVKKPGALKTFIAETAVFAAMLGVAPAAIAAAPAAGPNSAPTTDYVNAARSVTWQPLTNVTSVVIQDSAQGFRDAGEGLRTTAEEMKAYADKVEAAAPGMSEAQKGKYAGAMDGEAKEAEAWLYKLQHGVPSIGLVITIAEDGKVIDQARASKDSTGNYVHISDDFGKLPAPTTNFDPTKGISASANDLRYEASRVETAAEWFEFLSDSSASAKGLKAQAKSFAGHFAQFQVAKEQTGAGTMIKDATQAENVKMILANRLDALRELAPAPASSGQEIALNGSR